MVIKPSAKSIGVSKRIFPPHMVPIQLKILTPVGIAINIVKIEKAEVATIPMPVVNMWWLQTAKPINPIMAPEKTIKPYPKRGLREKTGITSETIPMAGNIRI